MYSFVAKSSAGESWKIDQKGGLDSASTSMVWSIALGMQARGRWSRITEGNSGNNYLTSGSSGPVEGILSEKPAMLGSKRLMFTTLYTARLSFPRLSIDRNFLAPIFSTVV